MTNHPELQPESFSAFFHALYNRSPFRWQAHLAEQACHGDWPRFIKLPTSSGKTSCLDIAVFALAHQAWRRRANGAAVDAPRRIFFVVDRRIIVNEAFLRANHLKKKLKAALDQDDNPLYPVAWWLQSLADNKHAPPLDCVELRGGIYRDDAWVRSLLQPTIVTSTVDQVGSRLLFRGYGVSDRNLPIHAALTANDSLILLDEAHCSKPFSQTMEAIARYRDARLTPNETPRWAEQPIRTPFRFIEMTATPRNASTDDVFQLEGADYQVDPALEERHGCAKPIRLGESSAKGAKQNETLAKHLVVHADSLAEGSDSQPPCFRVAIVVNRVDCARQAFKLLKAKHGDRVELMIGRMRPIDRDRLTRKLQDRFKSDSDEQLTEPHFLVATQCLEVGADFDFDGMVCQCASLDALRQRFGRLNRLGKSPHARGVIVMAEGDKAPRKPDPIYGESLPATWDWLKQMSANDVIDFGIRSLDAVLSEARSANPSDVERLSAPSLDAPVLMPAHLDLLGQTAPRPALEPDVAAYLHGPNRGVPEVRLCWRADLPVPRDRRSKESDEWLEECRQTLAVCPPSSAECLSVPLPQFKAWLLGQDDASNDSGDVLGEDVSEDSEAVSPKSKSRPRPAHRRGVIWNGRQCRAASGAADELEVVHPNALIVLPATAGGWTSLGYVPDAPAEPDDVQKKFANSESSVEWKRELARIDEATAAFRQSRDRHILRVHRDLMTSPADNAALAGLWEFLDDENRAWHHSELRRADETDTDEPPSGDSESHEPGRSKSLREVRAALASVRLAKQAPMVRYHGGFVVTGPRISPRTELPRASFDDDFDEHNIDADGRQSLADHLADVTAETERLVANIALEPALANALIAAAERHDLGKADPRFQAMLLGSSLDMAWMQPKLWAKSARGPAARQVPSASEVSARNMDSDQLPIGFRHELLSLDFAQQLQHDLNADSAEVMLHAVTAHHGHARPFAPVVFDEAPPAVSLEKLFPSSTAALNARVSTEHRLRLPAHRLDSGISERFWKLNRRFGWWGLAWLESTLRLADWVASAQPSAQPLKPRVLTRAEIATTTTSTNSSARNCVGLSGANPLGFLAALGLFRHIATELDATVRLKWEVAGGNWSPTLVGANPILGSDDALLDWLFASLRTDPAQHWLKRLNEYPAERLGLARPSAYSSAASDASSSDRIAGDWLSCNGSDLCPPDEKNKRQNNQLQTSRSDYFPKNSASIVAELTREHLKRTLFRQWDYADPLKNLSLHLEPREDRRHAYQWHEPEKDPNRKKAGGMVGANRLAMEAWPLFQSVALRGDLQTIGFRGTRPMKGIRWTWPIWTAPLTLCDVTPVLNLDDLQLDPTAKSTDRREALLARGIGTAFRLRRILVEKTPNFTAPVAIFTGSVDRMMETSRTSI
ncbi:MAG: type I-U CRISPR-associated helicase/endonuclease Cas3 [Planctomycetaceae bacterium]